MTDMATFPANQSHDVSSSKHRYTRPENRLWVIRALLLKLSRFTTAIMMEETDMDNFADRLKHEFEDRASDGDMDESQDWFVNDKPDLERAPSPVASERSEKDVPPASCSPNAAAVAVAPPTKEPSGKVLPAKRSNTAATSDDVGFAFLLITTRFKALTAC